MPKTKSDLVWERLNEGLKLIDPVGKVASVITGNVPRRMIFCYGREIEGKRIFNTLNLSTSETVRYRRRGALNGCKSGYFVPFSAFEPGAESSWWAFIVNIHHDPDTEGYYFKL